MAAHKRALRRLLGRPVRQREWYWGHQVAQVEGRLATAQGWLSLVQAERHGGTSLVTLDRQRQLERQLMALGENRPRY